VDEERTQGYEDVEKHGLECAGFDRADHGGTLSVQPGQGRWMMLDEQPTGTIEPSIQTLAVSKTLAPALSAGVDVQAEIQKQNAMSLIATAFAQIRGEVTDEMVRNAISDIQTMALCEQYDAFELLYMITHNGHARGLAADVLWEISAAQWVAIYAGGE